VTTLEMTTRRTHLFISDEGGAGVAVESPQLPGFVFFRTTVAEARRDLPGALRFAGHRGPAQLHHVQRRVSPEGAEYAVRVAEDEHYQDRLQAAGVVDAVLSDPDNRRDLLDGGLTDPSGEVVFVVVLGPDRLGWLFEQLDERGDLINVAYTVVDVGGLFVTPIAAQTDTPEGWSSFEAYGLSENSTVSELVRVLSVGDGAVDEGRVRRSVGLLAHV
jgi:hypothetical protein